jgi:hypothetical protein
MKFLLSCSLLLSGCASFYSVDLAHVSHTTQHLGPNSTNYGYDALSLAAHYEHGPLSLTLSEGAVLNSCQHYEEHQECGGLYGPREVFTGTLSYKFGD